MNPLLNGAKMHNVKGPKQERKQEFIVKTLHTVHFKEAKQHSTSMLNAPLKIEQYVYLQSSRLAHIYAYSILANKKLGIA